MESVLNVQYMRECSICTAIFDYIVECDIHIDFDTIW